MGPSPGGGPAQNARRTAGHDGTGRDITRNHGTRAHDGALANLLPGRIVAFRSDIRAGANANPPEQNRIGCNRREWFNRHIVHDVALYVQPRVIANDRIRRHVHPLWITAPVPIRAEREITAPGDTTLRRP